MVDSVSKAKGCCISRILKHRKSLQDNKSVLSCYMLYLIAFLQILIAREYGRNILQNFLLDADLSFQNHVRILYKSTCRKISMMTRIAKYLSVIKIITINGFQVRKINEIRNVIFGLRYGKPSSASRSKFQYQNENVL